ncbi:signal transduction histidine kinase [Saccharothrix saharensis]|uniref:histidine kinase n=1 Tax=Saccharothrix saharensis TaxID=571190 RepID=A0A543JPI7_9PSEU|nr:histidine kinase [Saccharothrix saharensis]TQM84772.1 signal transduction histidine kinase [Saccharothrix saharensis]
MELRLERRDVLVAVAFFTAGLLIHRLGLDQMMGSRDGHASFGTRMAVLAVACAGQAFRHRAPVAAVGVVGAATAADLCFGLSAPMMMVCIDVLFVAALHGPRRLHQVLVGVVAVVTVGMTVTAAAAVGWQESFYTGLQVFSLLVVPVWWATNVRRHREGAEQVARIAELDRRAAVNAERNRMARDLHDVVAGHMSAIAIQSEAVLSLRSGDPETARTVLKSVRENSVRALAEMRTMIDVLRADEPEDEPVAAWLTDVGRLADVGRLVESAAAAGLDVSWGRTDPGELPVGVDVAAYRIVQEALTNAVKHAPGARTSVVLERQVRRLVVVVRNEVVDGARGPGTGTGLVSMAERAHLVGGVFSAGRDGDGGWVVRAEFPL